MKNLQHQAILSDQERQPCEIWTRIMGYYRPVSMFNPGKQSEFYERRNFIEPQISSSAGSNHLDQANPSICEAVPK